MRVIMFKPCFVPLVSGGEKLQTIRKHARCEPGDTLSLRRWAGRPYWSKQVLIREAVCMNVYSIGICNSGIVMDGKTLPHDEAAVLANADGFETEDEMIDFFSKTHGLPFIGDLIEWSAPAPDTVQHCSTLSMFATKKHTGILDKCECGAEAEFKIHTDGVFVDCTECANGTRVMLDEVSAMVTWNKAQRDAKGGVL